MVELLGYHTVVLIHLVAFFVNAACVVSADTIGLMWMRGMRDTLNTPLIRWLHWCVWAGLAVSIVSGIALFKEASSYLLSQPAFLVKVGFVAVLVVNSFVISHHLRAAGREPWRALPVGTKRAMLVSAGISFLSWVAVAVAATQTGL